MTLAWVEPSATDLSGDVTVTASHSLGDYSIGRVNVTASATDSSGNQASCFFLVTVTGKWRPLWPHLGLDVRHIQTLGNKLLRKFP